MEDFTENILVSTSITSQLVVMFSNRFMFKVSLFIIGMAGCALNAFSQSDDGVWSYQDCVNYAREHNISLQQSILNEEKTAYELEAAKAQWLPTLDFATSHAYTNSIWGVSPHDTFGGNFNLEAGWTVYNGGIRSNTIKLNEKQREIDALATSDLFRDIQINILTVYLNLLYARESIEIYEEAVKLSEAQTERARQLMEAGSVSRVDYAQLQAQLEQDNYSLVSARSQYATRRLELKKLLQLSLTDSISPQVIDWTEDDIMAELPPLQESYLMAIDTDLQLKSLGLQNDAADLNIAIAKAGRLPKISINAGIGTSYALPTNNFGQQLRDALSEQIGISLSIPLFDQKKTKVAVAEARVAKMNLELDTDQRLLDLSQTVETWYVNVRESQSRYLAAVEQEKSAALSDELINEKFTLGLVNPVELMTAHNNLLEARHSILQAKYMAVLGRKMIDYYRTAEVSLP